ncbi:hypothetical protein TRAPUB_12209 [Trametes pubescens]|uniref:CFEM domain-containing protein n=1 Tax=Trametes pubescens TaxID=154538 RepID=A0A1M2VUP7_TRAPU|nr:hypothetical protein TRAPUB_12209 [Trametes pubescens]
MQLSQNPNVYTLLLLSVLLTAAARDLPTDGAQKGHSLLPAPSPAPTSATAPVSACVDQCVNDALKQGGCTSLSQTICFCTNLLLVGSVSQCVQRACPSDEASVKTLYTETCANFSLPGLGSILPPVLASSSSQALTASTAPAPATSPASDTQPAPSASSATTHVTATPAATTSSAAPNSTPNPRVVSTDTAGTQVTVTVTSAGADASGSPLNPTVNGATRVGRSVLGAGLALLVAAAWSF